MSVEEFVDVDICQLPITYQHQFTGGVYRDMTEFRHHLIRADQLEKQATSMNIARENDRVRHPPTQPLFSQSNTCENYHNNAQRPRQNTQHGERNFRVNTVQGQAGRQPRNNNYRGRGSYQQRWNGGGSNRNGYNYNPGYDERRQNSHSYNNQGKGNFYHFRQIKRRNLGTEKERDRAWTPTTVQPQLIRQSVPQIQWVPYIQTKPARLIQSPGNSSTVQGNNAASVRNHNTENFPSGMFLQNVNSLNPSANSFQLNYSSQQRFSVNGQAVANQNQQSSSQLN
ncbi:hypothetical protein PR048_023443 [Dryococelus australis]|uniref:Uncharacterized protein n=1 Tax=Dryococelus australis TaxID=614101 RepID=A0ABQ9GU34_9NEOP|nr:hypothetical protein PR048_023443 [Dryococelus australis]